MNWLCELGPLWGSIMVFIALLIPGSVLGLILIKIKLIDRLADKINETVLFIGCVIFVISGSIFVVYACHQLWKGYCV